MKNTGTSAKVRLLYTEMLESYNLLRRSALCRLPCRILYNEQRLSSEMTHLSRMSASEWPVFVGHAPRQPGSEQARYCSFPPLVGEGLLDRPKPPQEFVSTLSWCLPTHKIWCGKSDANCVPLRHPASRDRSQNGPQAGVHFKKFKDERTARSLMISSMGGKALRGRFRHRGQSFPWALRPSPWKRLRQSATRPVLSAYAPRAIS
jgi:hypothetical protein